MGSSEWAAWVQAVGSVAAIFAAIAIAMWQLGEDRKRRQADLDQRNADALERQRLLAIDHAIVIFDSVFSWELTCIGWRTEINEASPETREFIIERVARDVVEKGVPLPVQSLFGRLHELGEAASAVQMAVVYTHTLRFNLDVLVEFISGRLSKSDIDGDIYEIVEHHTTRVLEAVARAKEALLPFYGGRAWMPAAKESSWRRQT